MSRVSLSKRLMAIRDALLPEGSFAHRLYHLDPHEKRRYSDWCAEMDAHYSVIIAERGPAGPYEMLLQADDQRGSSEPPTLWPLSLRQKLFPPPPPMTGDPAERYAEMVRGEA